MFHSIFTFHHTRIWGQIVLATILALALVTPAYSFTLIDSPNQQAQDCEGSNIEMCLRWGLDYAAQTIPVTGGSNNFDFGYNYWLVVGPAGGQPVDIRLANR